MEKYEGAEAFVEILNANGVEYIFFNPGIDTVPIQAALIKMRNSGKQTPGLIMCLDESVAMTAAHGHYMVSGRPQVVMVHAELGTLRVGGAMHNAQWGRVPVILWAGQSPPGQRVDWMNQKFDQSSIMRGCVKWDHLLSPNENIHDVLQRAFKVAFSEPCGPVYLTFPMGILTEKFDKISIPLSGLEPPYSNQPINADDMGKAAEILLNAKNPLIVAGYSGRYSESIKLLVDLAEVLSAPVVNGGTRLNFPTTHPLCATGAMGNYSDADVILAIDYDMGYTMMGDITKPGSTIIQIDIDPTTQGRPLWARGASICIQADSRQAIPALANALRKKMTPEKKTELEVRFARLQDEHAKLRNERKLSALESAKNKPILPSWVGYCISEVIDEDTILVNQSMSGGASMREVDRMKPGTLLSCAGGSIQFALGAALGAKLAAPDKMVVSLISDGGFNWGCPVATLWSANVYHSPFLSVIFNNQSYGAIRRPLAQRIYGENKITDEMGAALGLDICPSPDYATIAQGCGAYGRRLENPEEVMPALREAVAQVKSGRAAVLDVILEKG
jgi:acetolactate synthase-1/2/3 large subunit